MVQDGALLDPEEMRLLTISRASRVPMPTAIAHFIIIVRARHCVFVRIYDDCEYTHGQFQNVYPR